MNIAHRIRMACITVRANYLIKYTRRNKYVQSAHMIGYVPPQDHGMKPIYAVLAALTFALVVGVNVMYPEAQAACMAVK